MILLSILLIALFAAGLALAMAHLGMAADSPWLLAHIASAIAAYVLFGAAVVCAWLFTQSERRLRSQVSSAPRIPLLQLERWMFMCVSIGFVLLTLSLAVGGMAGGADFLWKLQHKTTFAMIAWLTFAALLIGHWQMGWRGKKAVRMVHFGSIFLLLAYVGTHFVLQFVLKRGAV
jgi:ABC-type uncharacterized transport system permease subunit